MKPLQQNFHMAMVLFIQYEVLTFDSLVEICGRGCGRRGIIVAIYFTICFCAFPISFCCIFTSIFSFFARDYGACVGSFSPSTNSRVSMLAYAAKSCDQAFFFDFPGFQRKKDRLIAVQSNNALSTRTSLSPGYNNEH